MKLLLTPPVFTNQQLRAIAQVSEGCNLSIVRLACLLLEIRRFRFDDLVCLEENPFTLAFLTAKTVHLDEQISEALRDALFDEELIDDKWQLDLGRIVASCQLKTS